MDLICPKCGVSVCRVVGNTTPVNVQVHCPFDGMDFGVAVPAAQVPLPVEQAAGGAPAA